MKIFRRLPCQKPSFTPRRLYRAFPSVLLGTLFNVLDAVSTGLLIFPSDGATFKALQLQAMSMYIMSTILSQITMTLGGSLFPGALGAMLIEILPFLRGIGSDIQHALGNDSPALIPTVMVAYALTSFLIGAIFIVLGVFKGGLLVAYFPRSVLTGVIGGIGVSLFILGLGLTFPASSPRITVSNIRPVLFGADHLPLLFASCIPAALLSITIRSELLRCCTGGATKHAYYVPVYLILIPIIFWIKVAISQQADAAGMAMLVKTGWLFEIDDSTKQQSGSGYPWVYWTLFDFSKVEYHALKSALTNILLVVVIGVLNLPIYVPALGFSLGVHVDMNHEFLGQGAANVLAGLAGTVPNILQLSYSLFFTRAAGGRFEAGVVTALTFVFFLISSHVLPYVPTILASVLVLFLGIELTMEAVWESAKTHLFTEWLVIMVTLVACTFLGYAPGFGVGIGAATVIYLLWGVVDTSAHLVDLDEKHNYVGCSSLPLSLRRCRNPTCSRIAGDGSCCSAAIARQVADIERQDLSQTQFPSQFFSADTMSRISVVSLSGYVFFGSIPSLEARIGGKKEASSLYQFLIIDMTRVHRLETSVVQLLERKARENIKTTAIMFCGISPDSAVYADLHRGGIKLNFGSRWVKKFYMEIRENGILAFGDRADAITWCKSQIESDLQLQSSASVATDDDFQEIMSDEDAVKVFSRLPKIQGPFQSLFLSSPHTIAEASPEAITALLTQFEAAGGSTRRYEPRQLVITKGDSADRIVFIVQGCVSYQDIYSNVPGYKSRPSLQSILTSYAEATYLFFKRSQGTHTTQTASDTVVIRTLGAGDSFGLVDEMCGRDLDTAVWTQCDRVAVSSDKPCWTIEVHRTENTVSLWPAMKQWMFEVTLAERGVSKNTAQNI